MNEERRAQRRAEERRFQADVAYDVWRFGGNPDLVDPDRLGAGFDDGFDALEYAARELRRQKTREATEEQRC